MSLKNFIKARPFLFWYIKNPEKVSPAVALEQVLNFGDFKDVKNIIKIIGPAKTAAIFKQQSLKARSNYRPEIKNYFTLYFKKYA
ncbi:MAG: hypothetical protein PHO56_05275 [Patescibacteria group bacterium]|nr:hypothetical protein [Patescibacteria group bacterium]